MRKTASILILKSGIINTKKYGKLTILELDLMFIKPKSYSKFRLNISEHIREKCKKQCIVDIRSYRRDITPTNSNGN